MKIQEQNFNLNKDLISLSEASRLYGFSHGYLKILIHRGKLEAFKNGRNWFTTKECLHTYFHLNNKKNTVSKLEPVNQNQSVFKDFEIDVFQKIAASFSSDIVKE